MATPDPVEVEGLNHAYGQGALRKQILFDISTSIPAGQIVIVTGPSGSGKTTLLTLVGALRSAQEGSLRILGEELRGAKSRTLERVRKQIGFIFQQHNLLQALSALQNVELGIRVTGRVPRLRIRKRATEMLAAVGLADRIHHKPQQLSGGQRQRVAIARALAAEPAMLLADEPTASLDKQSGREVVERMQLLAKERQTTILLVTHDNRILDVADHILYLEDGRIATFTDAVISDTQRMMHSLAEIKHKESVAETVAGLDEQGFESMLGDLTNESRSFLDSIRLANDEAMQGLLGQALTAFTYKLGQLMSVERASLFLVDRSSDTLWLRISEDDPHGEANLRIPLGTGIAGAVAQSGETIRVDDAHSDPRFNTEMDRRTGFHTRSILCLPLRNHDGEVFAVAQLLNPHHGGPFVDQDEARFRSFVEPLGVILDTWWHLSN